jgi:hypothetical protein
VGPQFNVSPGVAGASQLSVVGLSGGFFTGLKMTFTMCIARSKKYASGGRERFIFEIGSSIEIFSRVATCQSQNDFSFAVATKSLGRTRARGKKTMAHLVFNIVMQ